MAKPCRIQLSRRKGFSLQATSLAINGLPAANVARPSKWGNPFKIGATVHKGPAHSDRATAPSGKSAESSTNSQSAPHTGEELLR